MSEEGGHDERWVISYADLVTLLLGFFLILYATAQVDLVKFEALSLAFADAFNVDVKEGSGASSAVLDGGTGILPGGFQAEQSAVMPTDLELIRQAVRAGAEARGVPIADITVTGDAEHNVVIRLADHLLFASASATIRDEALPLLDVVAAAIRDLPNDVRVEGHTDNVPVGTERYPSNWELSSARATAVLRYMVEFGQLPPTRAFAAGYGEFRPVASNRTPEGRALNRRADIVLLAQPSESDATATATATVPAGAHGTE